MEKSCGAIVIDNGKILLVRQNKGHYSFPKGHMELGETEIETSIREVKEETNIDIEIDDISKRYTINYKMNNGVRKEVVYFIAKPLTYDLKRQESEISEVLWVSINDVYNIISYDNMKELWINIKKDLGE